MHILGIDPGKTGGLAILDGDTGQVVSLLPMPIVAKEFDVDTLLQVFQALPEGSRVILEGVHAWKGQGVNSVWSFAEGVGIIKGLVRASQLPLEIVYPQTWQKMTCGPTGKDKAVTAAWAVRMFPKAELTLPRCRKPHEGICDALGIAYWGYLRHGRGAA